MVLVLNSTVGSALPSGASRQTQEHFGITNESLLVLPVSVYLIGYVLGPLVFSPLSESYGRKWVVLSTFVVFMVSDEVSKCIFILLPSKGQLLPMDVTMSNATLPSLWLTLLSFTSRPSILAAPLLHPSPGWS